MLITLMNAKASYGFRESDFKIYPLTTKMMPGDGEVVLSDLMSVSVFIIGDDEKSIKWARHNRFLLEKQNAIGFMVGAKDNNSLNRIAKILPNNQLFVGDGDEFSQIFSISTYPVLLVPEKVGG